MTKKIAVLLADGFEEIEAVVPSDILARLGYEVIQAGVIARTVTGSHGFKIEAKCMMKELNIDELDAVFLPGGLPGATCLRDNAGVTALIKKMHFDGKVIAAICAAPIVLAAAGVTGGRKIAGYPGSESMAEGLRYTGERTESDSGIITAKGAGVSFEFAFQIAEALGTEPERLKQLKTQMFIL